MEEDDFDFTSSPNTSSNLASLFGFTKKPLQGNPSLTYTAPKPPKRESSPVKKQSNEEKTNKGVIVISKAVHTYKLENRAYVSQGLTGVVISGNHESHVYDIILYKPNKEYVCKTRINKNFTLTISQNNYASFYDNNKQNWSIMFQSPIDLEQFALKVAVSKFFSAESPDSILFQDLTPSTVPVANLNSTIEIIYSSNILKPEAITKINEEIKEKFKLSDCRFLALKEGLVGCSENGKRVLIVPRALSGTWLNQLNSNSDLLLEVKVVKIYSESEEPIPKSKLSEDCLESPLDSSADETTIKARGSYIKEALSNTKSQKANLISRMARMGQATLPVKQSLTAGPSDSEEEGSLASSPKPRVPRTRNTISNQISKSESQQLSIYQGDLSWQQSQLAKLGVAYQQIIPASVSPVSSPTTDPNFAVYVSESRVQAAELRMGISKISEKLDLVWNKLQNANLTGADAKVHQMTAMDSGGIVLSIQNLIIENDNLKAKVEEQKAKIEQQNDRIFQLLELNHKYLEQNSTSHDKQSEHEIKLKSEIESLQQKNLQLETELKTKCERIQILEDNLEKAEGINKRLTEQVELLTREVEESKKHLQGNDEVKRKELENWEEKMSKASEVAAKLKEKLREVVGENENLKSLIKAQKEEIESKGDEIKDSAMKSEQYEKAVEGLKKQISVEELKFESKISDLLKIVSKLEEEKKELVAKMENKDKQKNIEVILSNLKEKFVETKEYSAFEISCAIEKHLEEVTGQNIPLQREETKASFSETLVEKPTVTPAPRTTLKNINNQKPEPKDVPPESPDNQNGNKDKENKYKSYDQSWRTTKPPPPPLFDDEDDDDDWLN